MSLYTPQVGEQSAEMLTAQDRRAVIADLMRLRVTYPKLALPKRLLEMYASPPQSPGDCVFARTTLNISADLETRITPCQFGGTPDCASCGCMASAGLAAVGSHQLFGIIPVSALLNTSLAIGNRVKRWRGNGPAS
jgi:hypothetical protein